MLTFHQFKAFDSDLCIVIANPEKDFLKIFQRIETHAKLFEKKFSRFLPSSELNQLNCKKKPEKKISPQMLDLLTQAQTYFKKTEGIFDPTVFISLNQIGYNQSFANIQNQNFSPAKVKQLFKTRTPFQQLKINQKTQTIQSPLNLKLDLGGIAKGYWVDLIQKILIQYTKDFWISAGGDLYLQGQNEQNYPWHVGIQDPLNPKSDILTLILPSNGIAVATSGIIKRKGGDKNNSWHHLIDPRKGLPVRNSIRTVTVIAPSTIQADIMAKTILILGTKKGLAKINQLQNHECVIIDQKGKTHYSKGLTKFL